MNDRPPSNSAMQRLSQTVGQGLEGFFHRIGSAVGARPKTTIFGAIVFVFIFASGFSSFKQESRGDKLWIPQDTPAQSDKTHFDQTFSNWPRMAIYMLKTKDSSNVLTKQSLVEAMELHISLLQLQSTAEGSTWSYDGSINGTQAVCQRRGTGCWVDSPFSAWNYDLAALQAEADDAAVLATLNSHYSGFSDSDLANYLGTTLTRDAAGQLATAEILRVSMWVANRAVFDEDQGDEVDPVGEAWEEKFLATARGHSFTDSNLDVSVFATKSFSDEIGANIQGDVKLISIGYFIIILYLMINLGECNCLHSKVAVSACGILTVGFSIMFSFGFSSLCGQVYSPVHTVLPFVLLGIGVDDCFVSFNAFAHTSPTDPLPVRAAAGLSHAGVSILVTSVTDFLAFIIGSTTSLPALSSFCFYAAFGVLGLLILQVTFFYAVIVLDARRVQNSRLDCCCCCHTSRPQHQLPASAADADNSSGGEGDNLSPQGAKNKRQPVRRFLAEHYGPLILLDSARPVVLLFFVVLTVLGCLGASRLSVESHESDFIPDGSYLQDTLNDMDQHFLHAGARVYIVTKPGDYWAASQAGTLAGIKTALTGHMESSPYLKDPVLVPDSYSSWIDGFDAYVSSLPSGSAPSDAASYHTALSTYLLTAGARYKQDVVWVDETSPTSGIKATRIRTEHMSFKSFKGGKVDEDTAREVAAMDGLRKLLHEKVALKGGAGGIACYAYSSEYLNWETYKVIERELYQNMGLALMAVLLVTLVLIAHPLTAMLVFLCVLLTVVDILGLMYAWDLYIDTVAVINLVLAVGLSVDYSAHVAHCFMTKQGSRKERVIATLEDIGVPVLNGAISTFLAVVVLAASESYVFRVLFRQFFATCLFGVVHGMGLLPVLLSYFGPDPYHAGGDNSIVNPTHVVPAPAPAPAAVAPEKNSSGGDAETGDALATTSTKLEL